MAWGHLAHDVCKQYEALLYQIQSRDNCVMIQIRLYVDYIIQYILLQ